MAYAYRFLTVTEQRAVREYVAVPQAAPDEVGRLRALETELVVQRALLAAKTGDDRKPHAAAIATLEAALNDAPTPAARPTP